MQKDPILEEERAILRTAADVIARDIQDPEHYWVKRLLKYAEEEPLPCVSRRFTSETM